METFGRRIETAERIRLTPESVPNAVDSLLDNESILNDLLSKIQVKEEWKESLMEDDGTNNHAPWKRLGIFLVNEKTFSSDTAEILRKNDVDIYEDEPVLELHLPPQSLNIRDIFDSLVRICEYIEHNLPKRNMPEYIYGIC